MTWFVAVLKRADPVGRYQSIRADTWQHEGKSTRFYRGPRLVFQTPSDLLVEVLEFANHKDASEHVKRLRERRAGAATMHVAEYGVARRAPRRRGRAPVSSTGIPTESLTVSIVETGRAVGPHSGKRS